MHFRKGKQHTFNSDAIRIPYGAHTLKYPEHPQADSSQYGKGARAGRDAWTPHPLGAKAKLLRRLVLASSNPGDLVLDPFSGSGTTAVVAEQLGRRWLACDSDPRRNGWAIERLERISRRSVADWIELDRRNAQRRESIR